MQGDASVVAVAPIHKGICYTLTSCAAALAEPTYPLLTLAGHGPIHQPAPVSTAHRPSALESIRRRRIMNEAKAVIREQILYQVDKLAAERVTIRGSKALHLNILCRCAECTRLQDMISEVVALSHQAKHGERRMYKQIMSALGIGSSRTVHNVVTHLERAGELKLVYSRPSTARVSS
jgi:hypothetical protein